MGVLSIDIETFSSVDLKTAGVYRYVESDDFDILLFGYREDNNPVRVIDLASGEKLPDDIYEKLISPEYLKTAYNANFEITCINKWLKSNPYKSVMRDIVIQLDPTQWEDTMLLAGYAGYNGSLKSVAEMLGFDEDKQKDKSGTALINKFSKPRKPTKRDKRTRVLPSDDPVAWEQFKEYNRQDVVVETAIRDRLSHFRIPVKEQKAWVLDFNIQNRGLSVDSDLVISALNLDRMEKKRINEQLTTITGVENPKSGPRMKEWLSSQMGREITSLTKETTPKIIEECQQNGMDDVVEALKLRNELMKTSLAKYNKLDAMTCNDGKIHGILQFYGTKTGRWAGRGVQVQNLPRNSLPAIGSARELLKFEMWDAMRLIYGSNLSDIASQLIRTAFIPRDGFKYAVADYSAIEARVIAWLSGEKWRLDVFKTTGKIYEASAAQMFNVSFEKICDKNAPEHKLRAQGKVAELALGYQGGANALARMDYNNAIPPEERERIVAQWRGKSPHIVRLWNDCENAATKALNYPNYVFRVAGDKLAFCLHSTDNVLEIVLPSGRSLFYPGWATAKNRYGHDSLSYLGVNQTTKKIGRIEMYGGKIVENIIQATARDCLSEALLRLNDAGYDIKFHVHDEVIVEVPDDNPESALDDIISIMCQTPKWADGLPLNAEGFVSDFYMKD